MVDGDHSRDELQLNEHPDISEVSDELQDETPGKYVTNNVSSTINIKDSSRDNMLYKLLSFILNQFKSGQLFRGLL